jgi:hypothetical protein
LAGKTQHAGSKAQAVGAIARYATCLALIVSRFHFAGHEAIGQFLAFHGNVPFVVEVERFTCALLLIPAIVLTGGVQIFSEMIWLEIGKVLPG